MKEKNRHKIKWGKNISPKGELSVYICKEICNKKCRVTAKSMPRGCQELGGPVSPDSVGGGGCILKIPSETLIQDLRNSIFLHVYI